MRRRGRNIRFLGHVKLRKIGVVSCARSDYGIYLPVLKRIRSHPDLKLHIFATGMHLSPEFGRSESAFAIDGFEINDRVETLLSSDTPEGIAKSVGLGVVGFAQVFAKSQPDILLLLGDRFDMFSAAIAALPFNIPIAHIHGGETTEGAIDEAIRHSISKMSHLHFTTTDTYAQRLRQMGEESWRIVISGAPGIDNITEMELDRPSDVARSFHLDESFPTLLVTFHPVTLEHDNTEMYIKNLLSALHKLEAQILFTYPNADTAGRIIINHIEHFCRNHDRAQVIVNATQRGYLSLMQTVDGMVGNSSSGIIEAASFKLPVVNIGNRQRGRVHGMNVVNCSHELTDILAAIRQILEPDFRKSLRNLNNPYGDGHSSERIVSGLAKLEVNQDLLIKKFADIECGNTENESTTHQ